MEKRTSFTAKRVRFIIKPIHFATTLVRSVIKSKGYEVKPVRFAAQPIRFVTTPFGSVMKLIHFVTKSLIISVVTRYYEAISFKSQRLFSYYAKIFLFRKENTDCIN